MDRWFEAYGAWPPINQMIFSIIVLVVGLVLLSLVGLWLFQVISQLTVWLRGWPEDERGATLTPALTEVRPVERELLAGLEGLRADQARLLGALAPPPAAPESRRAAD